MMNRLMTLVVAAVLVLTAAYASAHDNFRVIGTLTKAANSAIQVKTKEGRLTSMRLDKQTEISRDKKKVDAKELKAGLSVVIDAYGDSLEDSDLLAIEIRIVPPIAAR
jgi:Skp family chaperone for outer membrane proteins